MYGQHEYTHALVEDLERESADYLIIDNGGDYPKLGGERVIRPGENLGWAGGSEMGFRIAFSDGYSHAMTLNNDTRVSKGFVGELLNPRLPDDAGIIGPLYDDPYGFTAMRADYDGPAADYIPVPRYRKLSALDGTAMVVSRKAWRRVGGFDLRLFGRYGWGADLDLSFRMRRAGFGIYATEMAFINHFGRKTAHAVFGQKRYHLCAKWRANLGMRYIYGKKWFEEFATAPVVVDLAE
ncbi:glycosyltransferase family 2 protein [Mycobacterium palustre]|nr:glycosyltransferase family 2 protein [Mycobacterium palustre]